MDCFSSLVTSGRKLELRGESMASSSESERTLDAAVGGIPRVAKAIAEIPTALRQRALEAAERSYRQTVRDLGYPEPDAEVWTCAVIFRVRSQVAQYEEAGGGESEAEIINKIRKAARHEIGPRFGLVLT